MTEAELCERIADLLLDHDVDTSGFDGVEYTVAAIAHLGLLKNVDLKADNFFTNLEDDDG